MENREGLIVQLLKHFLNDLSESAKLLDHAQTIDFIGILTEYLKGVYNYELPNLEYGYEGSPFDEDEFIEHRLLKPYREKMVPFVKTSLRYYFGKDDYTKALLFQKLGIKQDLLNEEEYQDYILRVYAVLTKIKENLYLKPEQNIAPNLTQDQNLLESPDEIVPQGFKSKNRDYTRIRQILLFYFLSKLAGMTRLEASARKYAQFAHVLFYYPTDNIDGSEVYKLLKKAPYLKENKALLKDLEFVKAQFELVEHAEGVALVQKEIDFIKRR